MLRLIRRKQWADGRIEIFEPLLNADGYYVLADRAVDSQHNKAVNQFYLKDIKAVAARIRKGGVSLRMRGQINGQPNLISAKEIQIEDDQVNGRPLGDDFVIEDPFASFDEWSSDGDERAYRDL